MTREDVEMYIYKQFDDTTTNTPWTQFPHYKVFRHQDNRKWFALVMNITYQDGDISTVKWALDCYYGFDDDENEYPIVIGNIYENPELIEAKNDD